MVEFVYWNHLILLINFFLGSRQMQSTVIYRKAISSTKKNIFLRLIINLFPLLLRYVTEQRRRVSIFSSYTFTAKCKKQFCSSPIQYKRYYCRFIIDIQYMNIILSMFFVSVAVY